MKIETWTTDQALMAELGRRLALCRLDMALSQAALAFEAGISKRTLERIEAGKSVQFVSLVRALRALRLVENLEMLAPAGGPRPMDLLRMQGRQRRRAPPARRKAPAESAARATQRLSRRKTPAPKPEEDGE